MTVEALKVHVSVNVRNVQKSIDFYRRMIAAYRDAEKQGSSAVDFEGQHIDIAHVKTAEGIIELAESLGL